MAVVVVRVAATGITTRRLETIRGQAAQGGACHGGRNVVVVFPFLQGNVAPESVDTMPSLLRFLLVLGLLAGAGYGAIYALAYWYDPKPREITISVPPDRFTKQH
jgi:hypothetical protein